MKKPIQLELPFQITDFEKREIFRDQAPHSSTFGWRTISAVWTPTGIKHLDSQFAQRIMKFKGNKKAFKELKYEILSNPHLHQVIKHNLVSNLERVFDENRR
jgi:UPF0288 family protein (methanogenesis marker protein 3)